MVQDSHRKCIEAEEIFLLIYSCHLHGCLIQARLSSIECGSKLMASAILTHLLPYQEDHLIKAKINNLFFFSCYCENYNYETSGIFTQLCVMCLCSPSHYWTSAVCHLIDLSYFLYRGQP